MAKQQSAPEYELDEAGKPKLDDKGFPILKASEEETGDDQDKHTGNLPKTQDEMNAIIKARLERDRATRKGDLDTAKSESQRIASELETANTLLEGYKGTFSKMVTKQLEAMPPAVKTLLDKLDPLEQMEWLAENGATFTGNGDKKPIFPDIPSPSGDASDDRDAALLKKSHQLDYSV